MKRFGISPISRKQRKRGREPVIHLFMRVPSACSLLSARTSGFPARSMKRHPRRSFLRVCMEASVDPSVATRALSSGRFFRSLLDARASSLSSFVSTSLALREIIVIIGAKKFTVVKQRFVCSGRRRLLATAGLLRLSRRITSVLPPFFRDISRSSPKLPCAFASPQATPTDYPRRAFSLAER